MKKIRELRELIRTNGSDEMKELMLITESYIRELDILFQDHEVSLYILRKLNFFEFFDGLKGKEVIKKNRTPFQIRLLSADVYYITRHVWEFKDNHGKEKTGDDLNKISPFLFTGSKAIEVETLFKQLVYF